MSVRIIAKKLGISPSTVSLALRSSPKISESTRENVLREADLIGYRPNAKINELMSHLRLNGTRSSEACFGVISFYETLRPWEQSKHLTLIHEAMQKRGEQLGYRLESLGLKAPGMSHGRFRDVLDARGIQGLLCFGSPDFEERFPKELDQFAVVTVGLSISSPMHRVTSHFFNDLYSALDRVYELGYRRPGLILGEYEENRSAHVYPSAYFGWCDHVLGNPLLMPVLRTSNVESDSVMDWYRCNRPDVIVCVHLYEEVRKLPDILEENGVSVPGDVGVAAVSQLLDGTNLSGMEQNQELMGAWAVELLASRIMNQDFGLPSFPKIQMVESKWIEGGTLRNSK
ncbi:substrate-binding domain-containing protein [Pelagicoccus mobilis]|uniref:LacI family DNA-binding transcriptional regulator n=1 Tax=Pelagicoccus mobilis TaxID=415221 RepID=A0A934VSC7_9BACT|nr:LacI family DNA-binding transcriptional regulator [Pelagicoccus mobilis]MBK1878374.1 LacI family DNA-binding transcriptional regulator [Pelagicoccus mobilis]